MNNEKIASELLMAAKEIIGDINYNRYEKSLSNRARRYVSDKFNINIRTYFPEGTDLEIVTYENAESGTLDGIAFQGRATKPLWYHYFESEQNRQRQIEDTIKARKRTIERKNKERKERMEFEHSLREGDFLYSSWGYDQTNVDFYQVVGVKGKMVEIREVAKKIVRSSPPQDYVEPVENKFIGSTIRKKVGRGDTVRITSFSYARKWDGKPKYQTSSGWGH